MSKPIMRLPDFFKVARAKSVYHRCFYNDMRML